MNIHPLPETSNTEAEQNEIPEKVPTRWYVLAPVIALLGGLFGILGAVYTELRYGSILVTFVGAPIIEEVLKPSGVYFLLGKRPQVLRNRVYTAVLSALGGFAFAVIENLVYFNIYIPDAGTSLILWRYTVGLGVHTVASFIFGFGINQKLLASVKGEISFLSTGKQFFFTAMCLHAVYNIAVALFGSKLGF